MAGNKGNVLGFPINIQGIGSYGRTVTDDAFNIFDVIIDVLQSGSPRVNGVFPAIYSRFRLLPPPFNELHVVNMAIEGASIGSLAIFDLKPVYFPLRLGEGSLQEQDLGVNGVTDPADGPGVVGFDDDSRHGSFLLSYFSEGGDHPDCPMAHGFSFPDVLSGINPSCSVHPQCS